MRVARQRPSVDTVSIDPAGESTVDSRVLFLPADVTERTGYRRVERSGTGLVTISVRHGSLRPHEAHAISRFRLQQYVLAGLYDGAIVRRLGVTTDPAMSLLAADDMHVAVGDTTGQFLCYLSMQSPLPTATSHPSGVHAENGAAAFVLGDTMRAYFPCESEYGLDIFTSHPILRDLPLTHVRELTRLVRAHGSRDRRAALALIEAVVGMVRALLDPEGKIAAIIGCSVAEARRLLHGLGMPMAYAPLAPIIGDNQGGALLGSELLWSGASHAPGRFWLFALLTCDLADERDYIELLDAALDLSEGEALREVSRIRRRGPRKPSRLVVAPQLSGDTLWTDDPYFPDVR